MKHFGNFGTGLGQGIPGGTMINPYFDLWGTFTADQVQGAKNMVAYYPASMYPKEDHGKKKHVMGGVSRGVIHGPIGKIVSSRTMGR